MITDDYGGGSQMISEDNGGGYQKINAGGLLGDYGRLKPDDIGRLLKGDVGRLGQKIAED